jgi:hypothetical protein
MGMAGGIIIVEAMKRAGYDLTRATLISSARIQYRAGGFSGKYSTPV